ncbi:two-component regulator propeller domain-containing protein [Spirosoma sp. KNUC1025]|uniref:ligand-binding sensor domain-containing protein n=1 Tax=Spirosoma sp. KNUC1025 TaxID=2894082 RepID=UPI003863FF31|nr:hypothetical protein LN737_14700 [Spirosoma sp. KNUC1025]
MQGYYGFIARWQYLFWFFLSLFNSIAVPGLAQSAQLPTPEIITDQQGLPQAFITGVVQDQQGFMWMATRDGLCRYDGRTFRVFRPESTGKPSLSFPGLNRLVLDHRGTIWIMSERGDLDRFDPRTETFTNISRLPIYQQTFQLSVPADVWLDRRDRLWIAFTNRGIGLYDTRTGQAHHYRHQTGHPTGLPDDVGVGCVTDNQGRCWVATRQGLSIFDEKRQCFTAPPFPVPHEGLNGFYRTRTGEFLIGSSHHLIRLNPLTGQTRLYSLPPKREFWNLMLFSTDSRGAIYFLRDGLLYQYTDKDSIQMLSPRTDISVTEQGRSLWVDRSDVLWIGMNGGGIWKYDLRGQSFQTAPYQTAFHVDLFRRWLGVKQPLAPSFLANRNSYDFRYTVDLQQRLWFNAASQPIQRLDLVSGHLSTLPLLTPLPGNSPNLLATDPAGRVWMAHDSLAWWYQDEIAQWKPFPFRLRVTYPHTLVQMVVDQEAIWLATTGAGLYRIDRRTGATRQFTYHPDNLTSLSSNNLFCLSSDPLDPNRLWIGTYGSGLCLFNKRTGRCKRLTSTDGLPNNVIYSALADQHGYLWMGTNKGLVRMDRKTLRMKTFTRDDGLLADEFNRFHFLYVSGKAARSDGHADDRILMGGLKGITAFYPDQIQNDTYIPRSEITQIQVNNKPLVITDSPDTAAKPFLPVHLLHHIELPYDQNFLTVNFAVMQYNKPGKNRFRYQLEGLKKGWIESSRPEAIFTALSPGHYVLKLNASNTSGRWSSTVRQLDVVIRPPIWATWEAYLIYLIVLATIAYMLLRAYISRLTLQQGIALKEQETLQLRQMDELKTRFFQT